MGETLVQTGSVLSSRDIEVCLWDHCDGVHTKMLPTISLSDMHRNNLFIVGIKQF